MSKMSTLLEFLLHSGEGYLCEVDYFGHLTKCDRRMIQNYFYTKVSSNPNPRKLFLVKVILQMWI